MKIEQTIRITSMDETTRIISYEPFYTVDTVDTDSIFNKTHTSKYIPTKGDKLWFYPGCDVPRFKVKQFCQAHNVAVVKYSDKATVRFIGPNSLKEMISNSHTYYMKKDKFIKWLDSVMRNSYEDLKKDILASQNDRVYFYNSTPLRQFCNKELFANKILLKEYYNCEGSWSNYLNDEKTYQQVINLLTDSSLRHQDDILSLLNTGTVLDQDMYDQIHKLFESEDKENTKLAMEAMANCDFQQSAVYLLLLLKEYDQKIYNSGNKHHVNFKSLLKYFDISQLTNISVDDVIDSLRHQKLLNLNNLNRLMPMIMERIREQGDMDNIKVKDIELTPEVIASIEENILDQTVVTTTPITEVTLNLS